ncbi:MAG: SAM-dependent methyltransferase [Bacteroidales bacterium]|nr:SAM-dependent methyltransferase [Bacteroidales bacterium]MDD4685556.1 SAM-dependent methyltransferase [Bacteroidales bacterium]
MKEAVLYLFPTPIADNDLNLSMPAINLELLEKCDCFIVEELRTARRFLKKAGYKKDFEEVDFFVLNEHTKQEEIEDYLKPIEDNRNIGLMSEAGLPCVADPGSMVVSLAQRKGIRVKPLVGASSLMMALMSSGFNGQNFAFVGYLPVDKFLRVKRIKELEMLVSKYNQTQIFIEAPYRNNQMMESLVNNLNAETLICVGVDISMDSEEIITKTARDWKKTNIELNKRNTVFLIYK